MVVMDWVNAQKKPPDNARSMVEEVLKLLHEAGYVFGDLRMPNVLFEKDRVKLVDFNWCGRYRDRQGNGDEETENVRSQEYAYYPLSMSKIAGMWADGMDSLKEIRPEHDFAMLKKLFL
jgi:hypothetical protein